MSCSVRGGMFIDPEASLLLFPPSSPEVRHAGRGALGLQ